MVITLQSCLVDTYFASNQEHYPVDVTGQCQEKLMTPHSRKSYVTTTEAVTELLINCPADVSMKELLTGKIVADLKISYV